MYASMHIYASMEVWKYGSMQVYASMQVCIILNAKLAQVVMSNKSEVFYILGTRFFKRWSLIVPVFFWKKVTEVTYFQVFLEIKLCCMLMLAILFIYCYSMIVILFYITILYNTIDKINRFY